MALNGRLSNSDLAYIPGTGHRVRKDLVNQTAALRAAFAQRFGYPLYLTDSYRTYASQERIFRQRYTTARVTGVDPRRWLGQTWWRLPGTAAAAVPGTSNHGWATAIDWASNVNNGASAEHRWMVTNAPRFGWYWPSWARVNPTYEPWHFEAVAVPVSNYRPFLVEHNISIPEIPGLPLSLEQLMADIAAIGLGVWEASPRQGNGSKAGTYLVNANRASFETKAIASSTERKVDYVQRQNLLLESYLKTIIAALSNQNKISAEQVAQALLPGLIEPLVQAVGTDLGMTVEQIEEGVNKALDDFFGAAVGRNS